MIEERSDTTRASGRWFLRLAYNGGPYHGWQSQPNAIGVQSVVEKALSTILRQDIKITGAGRTDTGVHAREMYAHFDYDGAVPDCNRFLLSLNRLLGRNIAVYGLLPVRPDAHARFDAISRTYRYYVSLCKSPFSYPYSWECHRELDVAAMNEAASLLMEVDDFTSFAKLHSDAKTNICNVTEAHWNYIESSPALSAKVALTETIKDSTTLVFTITADRFLRNMVRAVVGTLVEVGYGKLTIEDFKRIIDKRDRCQAGTSMPAQALYLERIVYPEEIFL